MTINEEIYNMNDYFMKSCSKFSSYQKISCQTLFACFLVPSFRLYLLIAQYPNFSFTFFSVLYPRTDLSLQTQTIRLQFCPKALLPQQTQELRLQCYLGLNGCGNFPLFSAIIYLKQNIYWKICDSKTEIRRKSRIRDLITVYNFGQ